MKIHLKNKNKFTLLALCLLLAACENAGNFQTQYVDPHIIFSSRRWWNYDIYITDIYSGNMTHITKNKFIDFNPVVSRNSKKLAFVSDRNGNRDIYLADLEWLDGYTQWRAGNLTNITGSIENDWTPVFSPVDERIVFSTYYPDNDNYDIFIMDYDGGNKENLTNTTGYEQFPQFSPDGSFIIYQGWQKGKMEIFFTSLIDKNRINITRNNNFHDIISHGNAFSPDGQTIVFTSERDGDRNIYITEVSGNNQIKLTSHKSNDYEPIFSPDGQTIVFTSERDGNKEIYSYNFQSNLIKNLSNNSADDWSPRYYPNNQKIVFQSYRDGNWEVYTMNPNGSDQVNLTNHPSTDYSFTIVPLIDPQ